MMLANTGQFATVSRADLRVKDRSAATDRSRRMIAHGDTLFTPGAARRAAYRVESGALCHYVVWPDGSHDVIEFAFPGDIVGLGSLGEHVSTAQAMVDTSVEVLSDDELERAIGADAALAARMASAADREFDFMRDRALRPGLRPLPQRLAAYILAVAGAACRSGETALEAGSAGVAALAVALDVATADVEVAMANLTGRSLIRVANGMIVVKDRDGLDALADV